MAPPTQVERFFAMGTRVELHCFGAGDDDALTLARLAIEAVDDALTIHRPSATTALNDVLSAGGEVAVDDPLLFDALVEIDDAYASMRGLFDPAADARRPAAGWGCIAFDRARARISASRPVALDFGGFGKGFALDRAGAALRRAGVGSALVSAGESSIAVIGEHPLGGAWPFAVPNPSSSRDILVEVELVDTALSISSTMGSLDRASMIRPTDGVVITAPRCTVVVDRSGARAEMLSTALLVADDESAAVLLDAQRFVFDLARAQPRRMLAA